MQQITLKRIIDNLDLVIAGIGLMLLSVLTFTSIITRYFFYAPFMFLEEVQRALLIWITMFAGCACFRYKQHVAIELVVELLPKSVQKLVRYIIVVVVVAVLAFMAFYGYKICQVHYAAGRVTNIIQFPLWIIYAAVPIACISMAYQCVKYELFSKVTDKQEEKGE